jgi:hypothetical protein
MVYQSTKQGTSVVPDHECSQIILVLLSLFLEIGEVQAAILQALHRHYLQTGHDGRLHIMGVNSRARSNQTHCWVCPMGADRDQANVPMTLPTGLVICPDDTETGVFTSSPGVRLEGARVETSDLAEIGFHLLLNARQPRCWLLNVKRTLIILEYPFTWSKGTKGWTPPNSGQVTGIILLVLFSFMVQLPRGVMEWTRERSLDWS